MKHIEQIQPEVAAYDLERIFREEGDATATAALTALLHNVTGCDIPQTDTTPSSEVDELVPLAVSILRRHWQTPMTCLSASVADRHPNGDMGVEPLSLADLFRQLIGDRVQGNEALGILPANDNIPAAVAALRERKIGGVPELPDGLSFARIFCDSTIPPITELIDDNIGWVIAPTGVPSDWMKVVPNLTTAVFGCKRYYRAAGLGGYNGFIRSNVIKEVYFPHLESVEVRPYDNALIYTCNELEVVEAPNLSDVTSGYVNAAMFWGDQPKLRKLVLGTLTGNQVVFCGNSGTGSRPNLIHLEIGQGTKVSLSFTKYWNPTTALAERLDEFLSNFRLYIADRLSDNGSGKTLTLSQEVRDAIHSAGIDTIITNKGWTISPVPTQQ